MAHEVADQPCVILHRLGAAPVGHPRGLTDGRIVPHIVDDADKSVIEDLVRFIQMRLHPRYRGAEGLVGRAAQLVDFGTLLGGQRHGGCVLCIGVDSPVTISGLTPRRNRHMRYCFSVALGSKNTERPRCGVDSCPCTPPMSGKTK